MKTQGSDLLMKIIVAFVVILSTHILLKEIVRINSHRSQNDPPKIRLAEKPPKLILIYTSLWGNRLWPGFETTERFNNWGGHSCAVQNCRLTYNRKMIGKADVVIFHASGEDMLSKRQIQVRFIRF